MEHYGAACGVILNDPQLRQSLIRDVEVACRSRRSINCGQVFRQWFACALHALAASVDPSARTLDLWHAPANSAQ